MLEKIALSVPQEWQGLMQLLVLPIFWVPTVQAYILQAAWPGDLWGQILLKRIFILLPGLLAITGLWTTMLAAYTVPFRSSRTNLITALALNWWDLLRAIWLFWVGIFRFAFLCLGWFWGLIIMTIRIFFEFVRELILFPFRVGTQFSSKYFQPGVPWLAVSLTILWSAIEAGVFTYTLLPTMSEVLSDLVGVETHTFIVPTLFIMLFLLISGSFACLQVLGESIKSKNIKQIIQMSAVEFFVMFLEVFFLYRELVDSVTPWIAQQTDEQFRMGIFSTLTIATFGWIGIRGMTWFLFARYGTPSLLAIMSRQRLQGIETLPETSKEPEMAWAKKLLDVFKKDIEWFKKNSEELAEVAILPVLQLLAVGINFCLILISGEAIFKIPFRSLSEVMETSEILEKLSLKRRGLH